MSTQEEAHGDEPSVLDARERAIKEVSRVLSSGRTQESTGLPEELQYLDEKAKLQEITLRGAYASQELDLRREYASRLLKLLAVELVVTNAVFIAFAWAGKGWNLETAVIDVWLGATVIQVVGVVAVVTRHLFPQRDVRLPALPDPSS